MVTVLRLLPLLLLVNVLFGQRSLDNAQRAQAMLGSEVWSRVITVRNESRFGVYPKVVHALVFELIGILWFYTDADGTQSFSRYQDRVEEEKMDFGPLLRAIEPGFMRWSVVSPAARARAASNEPLRNGCFIESVVALRQRLERGLVADRPRLLSYYATTPLGRKGHTVLAYETGENLEVFDPARRDQPWIFPRHTGGDGLTLARALNGREMEKARFLSLRPGDLVRRQIASSTGTRSGAPALTSNCAGDQDVKRKDAEPLTSTAKNT